MKIWIVALLVPQLILSVNILFLNTWNSKSHGLSMKFFAERLASKGNNVTIYSMARKPIGELGKGVKALETILSSNQKTGDAGDLVENVFWYFEMKPDEYVPPYIIGYEYLSYCLEDKTFQDVMNTAYDLILVDELFPSAQTAMALKLKDKFGSKITTITTTDISSIFSSYRVMSRNPVINPNYYTKGYEMNSYDVTSFFGRLKSVRDAVAEQYFINVASNAWMAKAGKLLNVTSSFAQLFEASHATFMDFPSRYGTPASHSINIIEVGEHCQTAGQLPTHLREFVEDPTSEGTIYIAFGSIVNWRVAPIEVIQIFFKALNSLTGYRVIFSYTGPKIEVKPHVKIMKWAPQLDILAHNKTVLFFTHGGLKSVKEGICSNTPMLFLPFFADQPRNALFAQRLGIAEAIYKKNITTEEVSSKINKILSDANYGLRIRKVNRQYLDNVIDPLEYGSHWAMRLAKQSDVHSYFYKSRGRLLSWISFLYLDTIFGVFVLCFVVK